MSITSTNPQWFAELSNREQQIAFRIENDARSALSLGLEFFSLTVSPSDHRFMDKLMTVPHLVGWDFVSVVRADSQEYGKLVVVYKRRSPAPAVDSVEDMEGRR